MKSERRNLYRLLHVQPEAPTEVITAVYRCLMTKLKMHPDLGGDHATAVQINEAYATLSDPVKRRAYDLRVLKRQAARSARDERGQHAADHEDHFTMADQERGVRQRAGDASHCPFCHTAIPALIKADTRCQSCDSPLSPVAFNLQLQREQFGRRIASRVERQDMASLIAAPGSPAVAARLKDMSVSGVSVLTIAPVKKESILRLITQDMDALIEAIEVRKVNRMHQVHARLLTARFGRAKGVFVSALA